MSSKILQHTLSLVHVRSNEVIPETFLHKLITENTSACGHVVRENGGMEIEHFQREKADGTLVTSEETISKIIAGTKKYDRLWCFSSLPNEFDEDEIQPFVALKDSKGRPILVIGIEGDFPGYTNNKEGFSETYEVFHEWLKPKLEGMYKLFGNNAAKVVDYLKDESFLTDFKNVYAHRGVLAVMPMSGQPFMVGKNEIGGKFMWGEASVAYGYTESANEAATPAKVESEPSAVAQKVMKKVSKYADDVVEVEPGKPAEAPAPEPEKQPKKQPEKQPDKPTPPPPEEFQEVDWSPPPGIHGKALKKMYRQVLNGDLPPNWHERPTVRIKAKKKVKSLQELGQTAVGPLAQAAQVAASTTAKDATGTADVIPVISGQQQSSAVDYIKKHLSDSKMLDENPLETQKRESKLAKFSELVLDNDLDKFMRWPTSGIFAFVKAHPEVSALALIELRRERDQLKASLKIINPKLGELAGTDPAGTSTEQKSETASTGSKISKYA